MSNQIDRNRLIRVPLMINSRGDIKHTPGIMISEYMRFIAVRLLGRYTGYTQTIEKGKVQYY